MLVDLSASPLHFAQVVVQIAPLKVIEPSAQQRSHFHARWQVDSPFTPNFDLFGLN